MNRYAENRFLRTPPNIGKNVGIEYKNISKYPTVPLLPSDIYAITEFGDRFESLRFQFYGDVSLWWIIAITNPDTVNFSSLFLPIGTQIRIPQEISPIIDGYNSINR